MLKKILFVCFALFAAALSVQAKEINAAVDHAVFTQAVQAPVVAHDLAAPKPAAVADINTIAYMAKAKAHQAGHAPAVTRMIDSLDRSPVAADFDVGWRVSQ